MKSPAIYTFVSALSELHRFDAIIDVRTPSEFAEDHLPGAINCPVLTDEQRIEIGTLYKQNAFEAKKRGAAYVARNIAVHIENQFIEKQRSWRPLVYCWRGGNRSGSMAIVFAQIGWQVVQLEGGYKAYRRHVLEAFETMPRSCRFRVICGPTGSGKSRLLKHVKALGGQVLDLEELARHKGSVLGNLADQPQPSQKSFDSAIWETLRRFDLSQTIYVESESKKVGNLRVPDTLMEVIRHSPCIMIDLPLAGRVKLLSEEYVHFIETPNLLIAKLRKLTQHFGNETISTWSRMAQEGRMQELVEQLLTRHYDPAYSSSIQRNFIYLNSATRIGLQDCSDETYLEAARNLLQSS